MTTRASTSEEVASHRELQVQMVADLGEFYDGQVFFSPDGNHILKGQFSRFDPERMEYIYVYQLYDTQGNLIADWGEAKRGYVTAEGIVLVTGGSTPNEWAISTAPWKLSFWSFDGKLIKDEQGCCGTFPELIFDPSHRKFVTFRGYHPYSKGETEEYLWSSSGQQIAVLSLPNGEGIEGVSFSSDGKLIAVAAKNTTGLLDKSGNVLHMLSIRGHRQHSHAEVYFSPDGQYLAVSDGEKHTDIWTVDGQRITTLEIQTVAFSPDSQYLIGQTYINDHYDEILLFDIQNNFAPTSLIVYYEFYGVDFDSNGERFVTFGCMDAPLRECLGGTATLWNKNGSLPIELKGLAEITDAGFFPNSDNTISAGCDGIVNYSLIIPSPECLSYSLRLHDKDGNTTAILRDEIGYFWISPDGETFLTTSSQYYGNAKLWRLLP
jgi:WD40 repeat protein